MLHLVKVDPEADGSQLERHLAGAVSSVVHLDSRRLHVSDDLNVRRDSCFLRLDSLLEVVDHVLAALQRVKLLSSTLVVLLPFAEAERDVVPIRRGPLAQLHEVVLQLV